MPWNHLYSPLDQTVDRLDWLAKQLREDLTTGTEFTRDDGFAVLAFVERMLGDLRPLQDLKIQERR